MKSPPGPGGGDGHGSTINQSLPSAHSRNQIMHEAESKTGFMKVLNDFLPWPVWES